MTSLIQNQTELKSYISHFGFYLRRRRGHKINNFPGPRH